MSARLLRTICLQIRGSKVCVLPSSAPTNGAFQIHQHHDHICEIQNSNAAGIVTARIPLPPAIRLPTNRTHFVPIRESAYKEADGQGLSQNKQTPCLLMLFLSGPGAQGLKGYFKSHVQHDCFELSVSCFVALRLISSIALFLWHVAKRMVPAQWPCVRAIACAFVMANKFNFLGVFFTLGW